MRELIRRLFCKHSYQISRWHWFHGFNGNEPSRIEEELVCCNCGKIVYSYPKRGSQEEKYIMEKFKEWEQ